LNFLKSTSSSGPAPPPRAPRIPQGSQSPAGLRLKIPSLKNSRANREVGYRVLEIDEGDIRTEVVMLNHSRNGEAKNLL
jgi:hypothetical protein